MELLHNTPLIAALLGILIAQFVKIPIHFIATKEIDWGLFTSTGGMPSSHSAAVSALTTAIALESGLSSPLFAISAIFSVVVMFDASGIRYQAGQQAIIINQMRKDFHTFIVKAKALPDKNGEEKIEDLKTLLGHRPIEVFFGCLTGIVLSMIIYTFK
ncbi:divergent PAP2 family protein [Rummeliibacillus pycnus]|uniref:divergent PAP2 family protein n=1 Tax=Rummeliibacillus pycnus TaxID=101070 RepID=UPI003D295342